MRRLILILAALAFVAAPPRASACPSCAETIPADSGVEEQDGLRLGRAYNNSILLMIGVPYAALGAVGFMVYRHLRAKALQDQPLTPTPAVPPEDALSPHSGDSACPPNSRDEAS